MRIILKNNTAKKMLTIDDLSAPALKKLMEVLKRNRYESK